MKRVFRGDFGVAIASLDNMYINFMLKVAVVSGVAKYVISEEKMVLIM